MRGAFCGKKPTQEFVPFRREGAGETDVLTTVEQNESQMRLGVRNNCVECFVGTAEGVFRAREVRRMEQQDRWDKEAINKVIGVPWRNVGGKWTVDRPVTQIDPLPPPAVPFEGARVRTERFTRTDLEAFGTLQDARVVMRPDQESEHKPTLTPCRVRIEECLTTTPEGSERLDRRREVLNEAIAKEVERNARRSEEVGSAAGELAIPEESKGVPIPPDSDREKDAQ